MMKLLLVFIGGGVGSVLRYIISKFFSTSHNFPYGTLLVNVLGSLFIGIVLGFSLRSNLISENEKLLLATGFCGGFTTFSTFAFESQDMLKSGDYYNFLLYSIGSFSLGIIMILLGLYLTR